LFARTTIRLEGGRSFIIEAQGTSDTAIYVQRAELNGRPLDRAWLTHKEIVAGGRLVLAMGEAPSRWGAGVPPPRDWGKTG
jgi:putative alpha-1,2-mannosidase